MKLTDYSHKTLLQHSREEEIPADGPATGVAQLESLRALLNETAGTPPLPELNRERILAAARADRHRRKPWQALAAAAAVALMLSIPAFRSNTEPDLPPVVLAHEDPHPLAQDFLLTELDLLDLQLIELRETAWFDTALAFLEDSI